MRRTIVAKSEDSMVFYPRVLTEDEVETALTNNVIQFGESDNAHFAILDKIFAQPAGVRQISTEGFVNAAHFREMIQP